MTFIEVLITVIIAVIVGTLFYYIFRSAGPWGTFWSFLLILILAGLAAEAWITPFGPILWDVAWIPTLFVILLFAILLTAAAPGRRTRYRRAAEEREQPETSEATILAIGGLFWIFIIFLLVAALFGIFR